MTEGLGSADALRAVGDSLVADAVAVLSADLVSDVPLGAVLAAHTVRQKRCTFSQNHCKLISFTLCAGLVADAVAAPLTSCRTSWQRTRCVDPLVFRVNKHNICK